MTRLYIRENASPDITPSVDAGWESSASPFARRPLTPTTDAGDTLTTTAGFTSTTGQDRCHRQLVGPPMAAGIVFNTSATYKCYVQALESAANDNIKSRLNVRVLSSDGTTVRVTALAIADYSTAVEWNTALRNKAFANGDAGVGNYTTVAGDRLCVEVGHNDTAGASISSSSRWGSAGSADLGENETSTSTTERPWFETSLTLHWAILGSAITTLEAFGTTALHLALAAPAIASAEAFGTASISTSAPPETITATAIASSESFGTAQLDRALAATGIASSEVFGTTAFVQEQFVAPASIGSLEVFGTPALHLNLAPSSIASLEAFGTSEIDLSILSSAIASLEAFGASVVLPGAVTITPAAIASGEALGTPALSFTLLPSAIATSETFGTAVLGLAVEPSSLSSTEAFGTPAFVLEIAAQAIPSAEAFGASLVVPGAVTVAPASIGSLEAFGTPSVSFASSSQSIDDAGAIASAEAFGTVLFDLGITPTAIDSLEAFGLPDAQLGAAPAIVIVLDVTTTLLSERREILLLQPERESEGLTSIDRVFLLQPLEFETELTP